MLVMNSTRVEWMPLHSGATRKLIVGNWKTRSSRKNVVPDMVKKASAANAEPDCRKDSVQSSKNPGIGTMKTRKPMGKASERTIFLPKNRQLPLVKNKTKADIMNAR